ncbi:copper homeostasis protein CutC [Rhodococcus sp. IEGM 1379]|uniref:copper homeostasis protein CutC n=1 Tax=Rhodococcus sp. IEGM 1379 TaxID=3047086 RepID=UPI0024B7417A|nr:copper homeostasis protein CutC [Rhodococcus sp. IEGM 1379]MDI9917820.1 copper homeostasis protein CutC [Rhodococcus sp. IEGM 1379]
MMAVLELAVQDASGARIAAAVGASRVELCSALGATGGLTPSLAMIEAVVATGIAVHPLIRSRAGGFVYSSEELDVMARDAAAAVDAGASGVVVGALTEDGRIDTVALQHLLRAVDPAAVPVTFHRAMDVVADRLAALDVLAELGVRRVLTSGGAPRCVDGLGELAEMAAYAHGRVEIMAGGGVCVPDIAKIAATGVDAIHLSARKVIDGSGGPGGGSDGYEVTDQEIAAAAASAVRLS